MQYLEILYCDSSRLTAHAHTMSRAALISTAHCGKRSLSNGITTLNFFLVLQPEMKRSSAENSVFTPFPHS